MLPAAMRGVSTHRSYRLVLRFHAGIQGTNYGNVFFLLLYGYLINDTHLFYVFESVYFKHEVRIREGGLVNQHHLLLSACEGVNGYKQAVGGEAAHVTRDRHHLLSLSTSCTFLYPPLPRPRET